MGNLIHTMFEWFQIDKLLKRQLCERQVEQDELEENLVVVEEPVEMLLGTNSLLQSEVKCGRNNLFGLDGRVRKLRNNLQADNESGLIQVHKNIFMTSWRSCKGQFVEKICIGGKMSKMSKNQIS